MKKTVTMHEAKTHLSRLVLDALNGQDVVIARGREPLVRLVPLDSTRRRRRFGTAAGLVTCSDDFDQPLADFDGYR